MINKQTNNLTNKTNRKKKTYNKVKTAKPRVKPGPSTLKVGLQAIVPHCAEGEMRKL